MMEQSNKAPEIGVNLKRERLRRQWSLTRLAAESGISKAMLSQIEANKVNPTVATVWKISCALKVGMEQLISGGGERRKKFEVRRNSELLKLDAAGDGTVFEVLTPPALADNLELYIVRMAPAAFHVSAAHTAGCEEIVTVLKGAVTVGAGEESAELAVGDVITYQSDQPHTLRNSADVETELLMMVRFAARS